MNRVCSCGWRPPSARNAKQKKKLALRIANNVLKAGTSAPALNCDVAAMRSHKRVAKKLSM